MVIFVLYALQCSASKGFHIAVRMNKQCSGVRNTERRALFLASFIEEASEMDIWKCNLEAYFHKNDFILY